MCSNVNVASEISLTKIQIPNFLPHSDLNVDLNRASWVHYNWLVYYLICAQSSKVVSNLERG